MTYSQAVSYLRQTNRAFCKPGIERVQTLASAFGDPHKDLSVIHVTGTNGKGSFCVLTEQMLVSAGLRVGRFSSPALVRINECVAVNGHPISDEAFARLVERLRPVAEGLSDRPTEFELLTVLAFLYFKEQACDVVLAECGMGGLTDATNLIESPLLSVITGVSVDHSSFLGSTVEEIAFQKAGIIKANCPVLWCGTDGHAEKVIRAVAREKNAPFYTVARPTLRIRSCGIDGTVFDFNGKENLSLSLLGTYQAENAANALTAVGILFPALPEQALRAGLRSACWPGRFEILSRNPLVIADGGHNPEGVDRAVESIEAYFPQEKVTFVTGIMADKEYRTVARRMGSVAGRVFCVTPENARALPAEEYAEVFRSLGVAAEACSSVKEALVAAVAVGAPVVCLGSLYMYAEIRRVMEESEK